MTPGEVLRTEAGVMENVSRARMTNAEVTALREGRALAELACLEAVRPDAPDGLFLAAFARTMGTTTGVIGFAQRLQQLLAEALRGAK